VHFPARILAFALGLNILPAPAPAAVPGDASSAGPARGPEAVELRFRDQATVAGERIRLGDVAAIRAPEPRAAEELDTLEVARSAAFGLTRLLDTELIHFRVLKPLASRFDFRFDRKMIRVTTAAEKLPADTLAGLINAFVQAMPGPKGAVRHWEIARAPREILVPAGPHSLELAFAGAKRRGKVDLTLDIRGATRVLRHVPITLNLRVEEPVLVALRRVDRDEPLTPENVRIEMRETTQFNETAVCDPARLMGRLAKATLVPGRIVTPLMVAIPPAVRRGQETEIVFRNGAVRVSAGAVCRQDGVPGQIITAKNLASRRLMRVRVMDDGRLEPVPGI
jgi:flagella basal body P-ring formation protein FlgA